jgi:dihydrofolate reductase
MSKVFIEVSLSLDGIIAGPNVSAQVPMGESGHLLYDWHAGGPVDQAQAAAMFEGTGAVLIGRRTFEVAIDVWGEDGAFGRPCVVVTHRRAEPVLRTRTSFEFVTGGLLPALRRARDLAAGQDVCIMGGATLARQYLAAGLVDELRVHLIPVVLGQGSRFFDGFKDFLALTPSSASLTPKATHLRWQVNRPSDQSGAPRT